MKKTEQKLEDCLRQGESEVVEFKESFHDDAVECLIAFANTRGGVLIVGVADNGSVCGTTVGSESLRKWAQRIAQTTEPPVHPVIQRVEILPDARQGLACPRVIRVTIHQRLDCLPGRAELCHGGLRVTAVQVHRRVKQFGGFFRLPLVSPRDIQVALQESLPVSESMTQHRIARRSQCLVIAEKVQSPVTGLEIDGASHCAVTPFGR